MNGMQDISIQLFGIGQALQNNNLAVPSYQRSYAWDEKQVMDLFYDIGNAISKQEKEYFLGSIVVTKNNDSERVEVIDGQQRLATTTILIAAIRDFLFESRDIGRGESIETSYLRRKDLRSQETLPRLKLNEVDEDYFTKRILSRPSDPERIIAASKISHKRIEKAAQLAKGYISGLARVTGNPAERLIDWIEYIEDNSKVIWVQVPDYANAFTIFETLNDRGLDLAVSDLLKNYLFGISQNRIDEVKRRWIAMTGAIEAVDGESAIVPYIRHLWVSKYGITREKELYSKMKSTITNRQTAIDFSTDLERNARLYAAIISPQHDVWNKYSSSARDHMVTLDIFRIEQIRPLLLAVLDTFTVIEVQKTLKLMVSWSVRFLIVGGLGGGTLENTYTNLAVGIRENKYNTASNLASAIQDVVPSDTKFQQAFSTASVSKAVLSRYYLRVLENKFSAKDEPELVPNSNQDVVNLEHILPVNPSSDWINFTPEEAEDYYNRIGNLTLLGRTSNSNIGNAIFKSKLATYKSSAFLITKDICKFNEWGPTQIDERQSELATLAVEAWPLK